MVYLYDIITGLEVTVVEEVSMVLPKCSGFSGHMCQRAQRKVTQVINMSIKNQRSPLEWTTGSEGYGTGKTGI